MNERPILRLASRKSNVMIPFDAALFHEKAMKSLERLHYVKAEKYFRRAAELDPFNPSHWCNLAGVLAELGRYSESTALLQYVVSEVDRELVECYFYMANNHANSEEFEMAELRLIDFMTMRPSGPLDEDVEELIDWICYELDRPTALSELRKHSGYVEHDRARTLLEEGKFSEAIEALEKLIETQPDFMPARNNLALAYYYVGQFERAMQMVQDLLERDPHNVHGMCNFAIFMQHFGQQQSLNEWMDGLRKMMPVQPDHAFKLATTMGILGDHDTAYQLFRRIQKRGELMDDASLYHYTAVAAFHTGRLDEAAKMWEVVREMDPTSGVAEYYLNVLVRYRESRSKVAVSYHYHLPFEEQFRLNDITEQNFPDRLRKDPLVRSSFFWALRYGDLQTKLQVLQAFRLIGDHEVEAALREFMLRTEENDDLKKVALFVLQSIGAAEPFQLFLRGKLTTIHTVLPESKKGLEDPTWQDILEMAIKQMRDSFSALELHEIQLIWFEYLSKEYPNIPRFYKLGGWAAALEYVNYKIHGRSVTYEELASRYDVSTGTIRRYVKVIQSACDLTEPGANK